tara:strand:- start:5 stop:886 length:882 start_codon:yes stop_codon:yes gene_type:complete
MYDKSSFGLSTEVSTFILDGTLYNHQEGFLMTKRAIDAPIRNFDNNTDKKPNLNLVSRSYSFNQWGGVNYTHNFSSDPTILNLADSRNVGIKKLDVSVSDTAPVLMTNSYLIPNKGELTHYGGMEQTQLGSRKVTLSAVKRRTNDSDLANLANLPDIDNEISYVVEEGVSELSNLPYTAYQSLSLKDGWINELTYNFNSQGDIQANIGMQFSAVRNRQDIRKVDITLDKLTYNSTPTTGTSVVSVPVNSKLLGVQGSAQSYSDGMNLLSTNSITGSGSYMSKTMPSAWSGYTS